MKFKSLSFFLFLVTFFFFLGISIFPLILLFFSLVKKNNDFFQALSSVDFQSLFHKEGRQFLLLQRSFYLATCTTFFSVLLGATFAWILAKYRFRGRFLFFILLLLPAFIPSYIQALLWNNVLGVKGVVNLWLAQYSYPPLLLVGPRLYGCCFVLTLSLYPYPFLLCYQHFMQMDGHQEESIQLYFKHPLQRFSFYFRSVFPTLQVTGLLVFLLASSNLGVPQVLNVQVYPLEIFTQYSAFLNYSAATLVSLPQIVLSLLLLYFLFRKENLSPQSGKSSTPALFFKRTPIFWIASLGLSLFVLTTQILPFGTLVYKIRSFQWLQKALENAGAELLTTLKLALGTATLFTLLSLILGSFFAKRFFFTPPFQKITSFAFWLCLLPLVLPGILLATGMVYLWVSFNSIYLSIWILIFGATARFAPFGIHAMERYFRTLHPSPSEAAKLYGGSLLETRYLLKQNIREFCALWILGYALAFGEIDACLLLKNPKNRPLAPTLVSLLHFGHPEIIASLTLFALILGLAPVLFYLLWIEESPSLY